ncbi:hypothetical protein [Flavobacterium franklandianum]|uniref:Lipoprotein n=1 Tax=Flavobacterium franklandianum TaxID=2594430 RepID=A0A553C835_9FLAO|nr:hypothetical protein [Flavobacterium franklandianum]TRX16643.1 hypothetical protein FNW17_12845 [Flavobacterium franklandianum]
MNRTIFFAILFLFISCRKDETKILSFKDCKVEYPSYECGEKKLYEGHSVSNEWELESAKRQLALCLCEKYLEKPDSEIKAEILEIYNAKEKYFGNDNPKNMEFDTILKKRAEIFDPTIYVD